jgi:hypothetical protein
MRIAAGVLIIVVAVFDLLAALGYLGVGALAKTGSRIGEMGAAHGMADRPLVERERAQEAAKTVGVVGTAAMALGAMFLVVGGLGIACGVVLFMEKAATFALVVGLLQIAAEAVSCFLWFVVGPINLLAFVAGFLVIVAALSYRKPMPAEQMS